MLIFLSFNQNKKEVIVFAPSVNGGSFPVDIGPLAQYVKPTVTNLGLRMKSDFRFDSQFKAVVKCTFFQLRQFTKIKSILLKDNFVAVIHAFIKFQLD